MPRVKKGSKRAPKRSIKPKDLAMLAAGAAQDKKALDVSVLEIGASSALADFFVICSGESRPQLKAICDEVEKKLIPYKVSVTREGEMDSHWILLDLGRVIVHVMGREERMYYRLEDLWEKDSVVYHF